MMLTSLYVDFMQFPFGDLPNIFPGVIATFTLGFTTCPDLCANRPPPAPTFYIK